MPDWIAHLSFAYILATVLRIRHKELVVIGAMIPDIVRILDLLRIAGGIEMTTAFLVSLPFHSVLFGIFLTGAISAFFFGGFEFKKRTALLMLGMLSHLALDGIMLYTIAGVRPLIPLSYARLGIINIVPSQSPLPAIVLGLLAVIAFLLPGFLNRASRK